MHFLALGLLVLGVEAVLGGGDPVPAEAPGEHERRIVVDQTVAADVERLLAASLGRPPTDLERAEGVQAWIHTEILVREARSRGLHKGDAKLRLLLAEKMRFVLGAQVVLPEPSEGDLRELYQAQLDGLRIPAQVSLDLLAVPGSGPAAQDLGEQWRAALEQGVDPASLGTLEAQPPNTPEVLSARFGPLFAVGLEAVPEGEWQLRSATDGWWLVRVTEHHPGHTPSFDEAVVELRAAWLADAQRAAGDAAIAELLDRYQVEGGPP